MSNTQEPMYFGRYVLSFRIGIYTNLDMRDLEQSDAGGKIFALSLYVNSEVKILQMHEKYCRRFISELDKCANNFSETASLEDVRAWAIRPDLTAPEMDAFLAHPIVTHHLEIKKIPKAQHSDLRDTKTVVSFIHLTAYSDLLVMDVSYRQAPTERLSLAPSLALLLRRQLIDAISKYC